MGKETLTLGNVEIDKNKFHPDRDLFYKKDVDAEKILVSNKISFGETNYKHFIAYLYNNNKVRPLHIMLPKAISYVKSYDEQTKWMYFLIWLIRKIQYCFG